MTTIYELLAKKAWAIGVCVFALLGVFCLPASIIQTVRLDGFSPFGWHIIDGAIHARDLAIAARDEALRDLGTSRSNVTTLTQALDKQNGKIRDMAAEAKKREDALNEKIAAANAGRAAAEKRAARLAGMPVSGVSAADAALSIDAIAAEGVQ